MNDAKKADVMEPWRDRSALPALHRSDVVLALIAIVVCALGVALYAYEQIAFFILLLLFVYTVMTVRSVGATAIILLTAVISSLLFFSLSWAALVLSLIVGTGTLAWLLTVLRRPYLPPICLAVAYVVAGLITESALDALLTLAFLPAGVLLAAATVTHQRRTTAICYAIGGFLITLGILLAIVLMHVCGTLEPGAIKEYLNGLYDEIVGGAVYFRDEFLKYMESTLAAEGAYNAEEIAQLISQFREMTGTPVVQSLVSVLFSILPALAVIVCSILGFEAHVVLNATYFRTGWKRVLTPRAMIFSMSLPAAILYVVSFFVTLFFGGDTLLGAAMQNLCLILLPGFCIMGWGALLGTLHRSKGGAKILWLVFFALMICFAGAMSLFLLALWGSNTVLMAALQLHMLKKMGRAFGNGNSEDEGGNDDNANDNDNDDNDSE